MSTPSLNTPADMLPAIERRWSPRAFSDRSVNHKQIQSMISAAAMAPSAYNSQPWRFVYSLRNDEYWQSFVSVLDEFNRSWAQQASALILIASTPEHQSGGKTRALPYHQFDCGAAWMQLALQAEHLGLQTHAMAGIHRERAVSAQLLPNHWQLQVAVAVGYLGQANDLPATLRNQETRRPRLPLSAIAYAGRRATEVS